MSGLERKYINLAQPEFKALMDNEGPGVLSGYASVFGEIDDGGDIIPAGAYADVLPKFLASGFTAHSHDWNVSGLIGFPVEASEDDYGLFVRSQFHSTPDAQAVRTKVKERLDAGKEVGLSIGYRPAVPPMYITPDQYATELPKYLRADRLKQNLEKAQNFSRIRVLPKVDLREHSVVTSPMNKLATVTAVKSVQGDGADPEPDALASGRTLPEAQPAADAGTGKAQPGFQESGQEPGKGYFESALMEQTSGRQLWESFDALQTGLRQLQQDVAEGKVSDPVEQLISLLQGFTRKVFSEIAPLLSAAQGSQSDYDYDGETILRGHQPLFALIALKDISRAGMRFKDHSETALAAIDEFIEEAVMLIDVLTDYEGRGQKLVAMRRQEREAEGKAGAMISGENRHRMRAACGRIKEAMSHMGLVHDDLMGLVDAATPPEKPKSNDAPAVNPAEVIALEARFLRRKFERPLLAA